MWKLFRVLHLVLVNLSLWASCPAACLLSASVIFAALAFTTLSHILISKMQSVEKRSETCVVCILWSDRCEENRILRALLSISSSPVTSAVNSPVSLLPPFLHA